MQAQREQGLRHDIPIRHYCMSGAMVTIFCKFVKHILAEDDAIARTLKANILDAFFPIVG